MVSQINILRIYKQHWCAEHRVNYSTENAIIVLYILLVYISSWWCLASVILIYSTNLPAQKPTGKTNKKCCQIFVNSPPPPPPLSPLPPLLFVLDSILWEILLFASCQLRLKVKHCYVISICTLLCSSPQRFSSLFCLLLLQNVTLQPYDTVVLLFLFISSKGKS